MFLISKKKNSSEEVTTRRPAAKNEVPTIISPDLHVTGDLTTEGDMQIDGIIEGNVRSGTLAVGESALVTGEINAKKAIIRGKVTGRIRAREVKLMASARVIGDIWHEILSIDSGAFLEGHCKHIKSHDSEEIHVAGSNSTQAVPLYQPKKQQPQR